MPLWFSFWVVCNIYNAVAGLGHAPKWHFPVSVGVAAFFFVWLLLFILI